MARSKKKPVKKSAPEPSKTANMKLYTFNAPEPMMDELKAIAEENMIPMSALIRTLIKQFITSVKQ